MDTDLFFSKINSYHVISKEAELAWSGHLHQKVYLKNSHFIQIGQVPRKIGFVVKGLLAQHYFTENGDTVIKYFFPEQRFAASVGAMLTQSESQFDILALEKATIIEYEAAAFQKLVSEFPDIALFYIRYMERHWIIEKEPLEITLRADTAAKRYEDFLKKYPDLPKRLKKHHIASYLGITPTQLSRIFLANK
ncbi:Crp/Fnr family transcriptional regulator [Flavobacterium pallidum]|uniref:Crp/Fnr family transcriptional regulator n=1 Tax=Flavobacterium pallidum TaxID=2172098 RepID=A0A2S1SKL5_9FLAO|nr:Crp/Fnr family transcriptional regulator [Flavobacterium pallidum]AWI26896.1 Crp/Fnr family transcriptional regulator [Flavobacterium pallidum]